MSERATGLVLDTLASSVTTGHLTMHLPDGRMRMFGEKGTGPEATVDVKDPALFQGLAGGDPTLHLGTGYRDGMYDVESRRISDFLGVLLQNELRKTIEEKAGRFGAILRTLLQHGLHLSRAKAQANVSHHYDRGNDYYRLLLGPSRAYTCAVQRSANDSIEDMQRNKHDLVAWKLGLTHPECPRRSLNVADIGCGFAATAIRLAQRHGARVRGVTLSPEQVKGSRDRIQREGLEDRVQIEHGDYRDFQGTFDSIYSIGMIEATYEKPWYGGHDRGYDTMMKKFVSIASEDAVILQHTITTEDPPSQPLDGYFAAHVFPGGRLPRAQELTLAGERAGLTLVDVEDLRDHYAATLGHWIQNLHVQEEAILDCRDSKGHAKYSPEFIRGEDYYLQASQAGFRHGTMHLLQYLWHTGRKRPDRIPVQLDHADAMHPRHRSLPI